MIIYYGPLTKLYPPNKKSETVLDGGGTYFSYISHFSAYSAIPIRITASIHINIITILRKRDDIKLDVNAKQWSN